MGGREPHWDNSIQQADSPRKKLATVKKGEAPGDKVKTPYMPFAEYAQNDVSKWRHLMALNVQHRDSPGATGLVMAVHATGSPATADSIVVEVCYGGRTTRKYSGMEFLSVHSFIGFNLLDLKAVFGGSNPSTNACSHIKLRLAAGEAPTAERVPTRPADSIRRGMSNQVVSHQRQQVQSSGSSSSLPPTRHSSSPYMGRYIFHMTHISNLPSILEQGALLSNSKVKRHDLMTESIAYENIKDMRNNRVVNLERSDAPGNLRPIGDFVPFYFCSRTPMLYTIHKGNVRPELKQDDIAFLASRISAICSISCNWCFSDGHAVKSATRFFSRVEDLGQIDWRLIDASSWSSSGDPDALRKRQAEFLVLGSLPIAGLEIIAGKTPKAKARIDAAVRGSELRHKVRIEPDWYF